MVNTDVFLDKTEGLRSSTFIGSFPGVEATSLLSEEMAEKVVRHAFSRLEKASVTDESIREQEQKVGWLRHSQISLGECLGKGSFSSVYEIKTIKSPKKRIYQGKDLVVKFVREDVIEKPAVLSACAADLFKEGMILSSLCHENVISVKAWTPTGMSGFCSGRADSFFLVLDRLKETLSVRLDHWKQTQSTLKYAISSRMKRKVSFLAERLEVIRSLGEAVKYIQSKGILHRDLKPDNIGFDHNDVLKLYDFDVSRRMPEVFTPDETFAFTKKVGSYRYMSPECAKGEPYNLKSDVYSFSLICHEIISLKKPFEEIRSDLHFEMVFYYGSRPSLPKSWSVPMCSLLQCCWCEDITVRPVMSEVQRRLEAAIPVFLDDKKSQYSRSWIFSSSATKPTKKRKRVPVESVTQVSCDEYGGESVLTL